MLLATSWRVGQLTTISGISRTPALIGWLANKTFCVCCMKAWRDKEDNRWNRLHEGGRVEMTPNREINHLLMLQNLKRDAPRGHNISTPNVESLAQALNISELLQRAEWVRLSAQFVRPTAGLSKCCPRAAVGLLCCPHPSPLRLASSLLHWTTAGSWTELQSVDVERDITGCNSPTPTRKVTLRLMSVVRSASYMLGHRKLGPVDEMTSRDAVGFVEVFGWRPFKLCPQKTPLTVPSFQKVLCINLVCIKHEHLSCPRTQYLSRNQTQCGKGKK